MTPIRKTLGVVAALATLVGGLVVLSSVPAQAAHVSCGQTITQNTTLDGDVGPCNTTDGIIVGASGITLNLNGFKVFSDAPLPRVHSDGSPAEVVGIHLVNVSNVTVTNGTVSGFAAGVAVEGGGSNKVNKIKALANEGPCIGEDFTTQAIGKFGDGIVMFSSVNNRIENNVADNNGPFSGISVVTNVELVNRPVTDQPLPTGNVVRNNKLNHNDKCFGSIGIRIEGPGASRNTVVGNDVNDSFLEGVAVLAVNNLDFSALFAQPPTCQNRGFPFTQTVNTTLGSPIITATQGTFAAGDVGAPVSTFNPFPTPIPGGATIASVQNATQATLSANATATVTGVQISLLPVCPLANPPTPTNDRNIIDDNNVTANGFGGPQTGPRGGVSAQSRAGVQLLSFCNRDTLNGTRNNIQHNTATGNAGNGVAVGGCPLTSPVPGFTNGKVLSNTSTDNNQAACGTLPPTPGCGARPTTPRSDLLDSTHLITCPSTSPTTQATCAGLGFPAPPAAPTPFVGTLVVAPGGTPCDNNTWRNNTYGTAVPPCTAIGGTQVSATAAAASAAAAGGAGDSSTGDADDVASYTRSGRFIG